MTEQTNPTTTPTRSKHAAYARLAAAMAKIDDANRQYREWHQNDRSMAAFDELPYIEPAEVEQAARDVLAAFNDDVHVDEEGPEGKASAVIGFSDPGTGLAAVVTVVVDSRPDLLAHADDTYWALRTAAAYERHLCEERSHIVAPRQYTAELVDVEATPDSPPVCEFGPAERQEILEQVRQVLAVSLNSRDQLVEHDLDAGYIVVDPKGRTTARLILSPTDND